MEMVDEPQAAWDTATYVYAYAHLYGACWNMSSAVLWCLQTDYLLWDQWLWMYFDLANDAVCILPAYTAAIAIVTGNGLME